MQTRSALKLAALLLATGLAAGAAPAQTTTATSDPASPAPSATGTASGKLVQRFGPWAGSPDNSAALVNGLRSGSAITLTSPDPTVASVTFVPPTKPMGYGNVKIALALAQQQLASQGISQPTPQQMQTALLGGPLTVTNGATTQTTDLSGVLQMRASGMGWGQIAKTQQTTVGALMSGKAATPTAISGQGITTAAGGATVTASGKTPPGKSGSGIVTAAGEATVTPSGKTPPGKAGSGIVTAAGSAGAGSISTGMGHGAGGVSGAAGPANAGGQAGSHGKSGK